MPETYSSPTVDSSALDRPFPFTIIPDLSGSTMGVEIMSLRELAAKAKATRRKAKKMLPLFNGAAFGNAASAKGSLRHDANVTTVAAVVVDYDGGTITVEEARATLKAAGLIGLVMTSPTNGEPGRGHRWRGVFPLSRPHDRAAYEALAEKANGVFGGVLDKGSCEPSRSYFLGHTGKIAAHLIEGGRWLDEADLPRRAWTKTERVEGEHAEAWGRPLHVLRSALMAIPNDAERGPDREGWVKIGMALHFEGAPFDLFDEWSAQWPGYLAEPTLAAWESFGRDRGRMATGHHILNLAEAHGWRDLERMLGLFGDIAEEPEPDEGDGLRVLSPDDCADFPETPYVLKRFVAERDAVTVVGSPGVGKSVLVPRLAYAIAQGEPIFGMKTRQGRVLYVATENERDMRKRVHALRREHGPAEDFGLVLDGAGAMKPNSEFLRRLRDRIERERPILVVIDTLAAGVPGFEENTSEGMGGAIAMARSLTKWGAAVIVVHHDTKAGDGLPRGHSSLHGIVDANLALIRDGGLVRGSCSKNRNGPSHVEMLAFINRPVKLGLDSDGEAITTVICEEADAPPREARMSASAKAALTILGDLMEGRESVPEDESRGACVSGRAVSPSEAVQSRRQAFRRAVADLVRGEWVAFHEGAYSPRAIAEGTPSSLTRMSMTSCETLRDVTSALHVASCNVGMRRRGTLRYATCAFRHVACSARRCSPSVHLISDPVEGWPSRGDVDESLSGGGRRGAAEPPWKTPSGEIELRIRKNDRG